jgi:ribosomal protein S18 acetylase RimI-like enzyme
MVTIRPGVASDADALTDCEVAAFTGDPMIEWMLGDGVVSPDVVARGSHAFYNFWTVNALNTGLVDIAADESGALLGGALWIEPGVTDWDETRQRAFAERMRESAYDQGAKTLPGVEVLDAHVPTEPHWYLGTISVVPSQHGNGVGGALLRHGLGRVDATSMPTYLEVTKPSNIGLYKHFGFNECETFTIGDGSPPITSMLRPAH